jgi:hypothetical protein
MFMMTLPFGTLDRPEAAVASASLMSRFRDQCFRFLIARGRPLSTAAEHISCVAGQLVGTGDATVGSGTV